MATSLKEEARLHYNSKDYQKAEPYLDGMLNVNPNDAWAMDVLSRLYMNTGRHSEAVPLLNRLIQLKPDSELLRRIVHVGCVVEEAEFVFRFATEIEWCAEDEPLLSKIYDAFWPDEICKTFFFNTQWKSDLPFPVYVQAEHMFDLGEIEQAITLLTTLVSREVVNESTLMVARKVCESLGQIELAHDLWANYLRHIDGELSRKRSLAKRLRHAKRYEEAVEIATMVLEEASNDEQMLTLITEIGHYTTSPETSLNAFHQLDSLNKAKLYHLRRYASAAIKTSSIVDISQAAQRLIWMQTLMRRFENRT